MAAVLLPNPVTAPLNYFLEVADGGVTVQHHGTVGATRRKWNTQMVQVNDIRDREDDYNLDKQGFELVHHHSAVEEWKDDDIRKTAYQECANLLKEVVGATYVQPFSHMVRRHTWQSVLNIPDSIDDAETWTETNPAMSAHIDQSYKTAVDVFNAVVNPADAERLSKTRWAIINCWRPLKMIKREPLAVCDARSVPDSDLRVVTTFYPELHKKQNRKPNGKARNGEAELYNIAANPNHKWYYASDMVPDEVLLIKCYDTKLDGRARRVPHTAFQRPFDEGPARESVEVRCVVFWEDQERD